MQGGVPVCECWREREDRGGGIERTCDLKLRGEVVGRVRVRLDGTADGMVVERVKEGLGGEIETEMRPSGHLGCDRMLGDLKASSLL